MIVDFLIADLPHKSTQYYFLNMNILYGIKNCDTIKKTRLWLEEHKIDYQFHDYRTDGLDISLLTQFDLRLGWETLLNKRSTSWRQLSDDQKTDLNRDKALQLMLQQPTLIKRPILTTETNILIGFNPNNYETEFSL